MKHYFYAIIISIILTGNTAVAQVPLQTAVDFSVKDVNSGSHILYNYLNANKIVVLDFFTTNCGPCQTYAIEVSQAYEHFGCNQGNVIFIGINWGSDNNSVITFDSLWGARYPSVSGLQGGGNRVVEDYQVLSYPTVIVITPDYNIAVNYIWPPLFDSIVAQVSLVGGIPSDCTVNTFNSTVKPLNINTLESGEISITLPLTSAHNNILSIYSLEGRLLWQETLSRKTNQLISPKLKKGLYIARLVTDEKLQTVSKILIR